jgi:glycosyltransferase 2 family protein
MTDWLASNRNLPIRLAGSLLALGMLIFLLASVWDELLSALQNISIWHLLGSAGLVLLSRFSTVGRWYVLLRTGGVKMPLSQALSLTFTGLFASHFLPTTIGGDVLRLAGAVRLGYDRAVCLASIAADRLVGMAGMTVILPLGLLPLWQARETLILAPLMFTPPALFRRLWAFALRTLGALNLWLKQPLALAGAF